MNLHGQIMNIRCDAGNASTDSTRIAYAEGHRDARHAAAEMVLEAEAEIERLKGERAVLVRLLMESDKVVSTLEGEGQEEWDRLADLRRAIAAATIPHRPEEADLLSLRACIGA